MIEHPSPWDAYLPKVSEGTLQGAMAGAQWDQPHQSQATAGFQGGVQFIAYRKASKSRVDSLNKSHLLVEIGEFADLEENWDGDNASRISAEAIQAALRFANALPASIRTDVAPNPNGTISIYLEAKNGRAEMEIGRTRYSWSLLRPGDGPVSRSGGIDEIPAAEQIQQLIESFRSAQDVRVVTLKLPSVPVIYPGVRFLHHWGLGGIEESD